MWPAASPSGATPAWPVPPADPVGAGPSRLFAYGTLQPGRLRWPFLAPFAVGHRPAAVPGMLYDSGSGWPVAVFGAVERTVPGTLIELDPGRLTAALARIDEIERTATDLLCRIVVTTVDGVEAWTYDCARPTAGFSPIERWDRTDER